MTDTKNCETISIISLQKVIILTQTDLFHGKCPQCGEALQVPSHLKQFSCMFCGARLTPEQIQQPKPEVQAAADPERCAAYYKDHILEVISSDPLLYRKVTRTEYVPTFEQYLSDHRETFVQLEHALLSGTMQMDDAVLFFLDRLEEYWHSNKKWNSPMNRNAIMENDKFSIAIFLVPMIQELKLSISEGYCKTLHRHWMERHPKNPFQIGDYESIAGGFRKRFLGFCFITTAVCLHEGKPDDCAELTAFRNFRDGYLRSCADGPALIERYYDIAPGIVARIELSNGKADRYADIRSRYLLPCYEDILAGHPEQCKNRYIEMVTALEKQYLS